MSTTERNILMAGRTRVAIAFPLARDISDDPHAVSAAILPAFAAAVDVGQVERASMGTENRRIEGELKLTAWAKLAGAADDAFEARLHMFADELTSIIIAPPRDLGDICADLMREAVEVDIKPGEVRMGRVDVTFAFTAFDIGGTSTPDGAAFSAAFSLGFA